MANEITIDVPQEVFEELVDSVRILSEGTPIPGHYDYPSNPTESFHRTIDLVPPVTPPGVLPDEVVTSHIDNDSGVVLRRYHTHIQPAPQSQVTP